MEGLESDQPLKTGEKVLVKKKKFTARRKKR